MLFLGQKIFFEVYGKVENIFPSKNYGGDAYGGAAALPVGGMTRRKETQNYKMKQKQQSQSNRNGTIRGGNPVPVKFIDPEEGF